MSSTGEAAPASSAVAAMVLVPASIGWCTSLLLCGIATDRAIAVLRRSSRPGNAFARPLLVAAVTVNALGAVNVYASLISKMVLQERSERALADIKLPDALAPIFAGTVGAVVQTFMTIRCWRLLNHNSCFLAVAGTAVTVALAGALWSAGEAYAVTQGASLLRLYVPGQIWLWTSLAVDSLITFCLVYLFTSMKRHESKPSEYLNSLIRLSFETCCPPTICQILSVTLYASLAKSDHLWNVFTLPASMIPSLFVLSFVYCLEGTAKTQSLTRNVPDSIDCMNGPVPMSGSVPHERAGSQRRSSLQGARRGIYERSESELSTEEGLKYGENLVGLATAILPGLAC